MKFSSLRILASSLFVLIRLTTLHLSALALIYSVRTLTDLDWFGLIWTDLDWSRLIWTDRGSNRCAIVGRELGWSHQADLIEKIPKSRVWIEAPLSENCSKLLFKVIVQTSIQHTAPLKQLPAVEWSLGELLGHSSFDCVPLSIYVIISRSTNWPFCLKKFNYLRLADWLAVCWWATIVYYCA